MIKSTKEYDKEYLIPQINSITQQDLDEHISQSKESMFYNLFFFIICIELSSEGLHLLYLYPENEPFLPRQQNGNTNQYTLIHIILSSIGFIFGIFSGYVNDFVKRKYSFMIYLIPYYAIIFMQITLASVAFSQNENYIESLKVKQDRLNMKQIVLIIEFFWHMIQDGYKVVTYFVMIDYFLNKKYSLYFALIVLAQQDITYSLQTGIYSFFVYTQNPTYYNDQKQKDQDSIDDLPKININIRIILLVIYSIIALISIIPFRKVLQILQEKHQIEEQDANLQKYNLLGANKQNILENFSYLINKKTYIIYTSLFTWISTYQSFFFESYANSENNIYTPINNILNPIFSITFTIYYANKFKQETNCFGLFLDKKMRIAGITIQIFNFFMLIANSCKGGNCDGDHGQEIQKIFLAIMFFCSSFIGTASNFILICSILKIAEIFNVRSKVLGSAYSIYISALYGFEVIDYILYYQQQNKDEQSYFSTILYSVYFALNSLSLFAMIIIHSSYHKTVKKD